jgi:OFA family oxalate/formate antiporter-like MFS transporter
MDRQGRRSEVEGGHVGNRWWRLAAGVLAMMAIANLQYAWTLFTIPLTQSLGVKLSAVQLTFTLFILTETWLVPFEGYLVDRIGARLIVTLGGVLVGIGWIASGMVNSLGGLYFWYCVGGLGAGAVYGACVGTALKWFPDHRGLAAGATAGAYGFGTALTVLPISYMINHGGYRSAFIIWGIIQGIVVVIAAQFLVAPARGWKPAGWEQLTSKIQDVVHQSAVSSTPFQMIRTGTFWLMYFIMTLVAFGGLMVTAQLKPIAAAYGLDKTVVLMGVTALGLALMLDRILNGLTRPFWGWVSDHIGRYNTMAIAFAAEAVAIVALLHLVHHPIWFVVLTGFTFFAWGEIFSLFPAAIGDVFGPDYATTNYGIQYTAKGLAAIFAGWGAAAIMELAGSWIPVFWVAVACDALAAVLALFALKPLVAKITSEHRLQGAADVGLGRAAPS